MAFKKPNFLAVFMLVSSLLLLYIGVPRFLAELMLVPGTPIIERLNRGEIVSEKELDVAQESREQAVSFVDHPKAYSELGTVFLTRAQTVTDSESKKEFASQAIIHLEKTLSLAPLNTFAWLRLSSARLLLGGKENRGKALEAWRNSVATASFEPFVLIPRLHTGIILHDIMTDEDKATLREQADLTYNWNRGQFRSYARKHQLVEWGAFLLSEYPEKAEWIAAK